MITCSDSISLLLMGPIFQQKKNECEFTVIFGGGLYLPLPSSQPCWIITTFQGVSCIKENTLSLAFNIINANESILAGKQQKPINRKPPILQCGISAALLTCFQTIPPFAGTALIYPVSLAACISCFGSHEDPKVTSSVSIVRHV